MKKGDAEESAKKYAVEWGVSWHRVTSTRIIRPGWFVAVSAYEFEIDTGNGSAIASVYTPSNSIQRFEYYPNNPMCFMVPLWAAYPGQWRCWGGWRQSYGEDYKFQWFAWWQTLSDEMKVEYQNRYPEPEDEEMYWQGFYKSIVQE